jgi:FlaA1/EpsC-like NDP-sugar epimerase
MMATSELNSRADVTDLLGRKPERLDSVELQAMLGGRSVMVTGAGGSIGSEMCRQVLRFCPHELVMVDHCENALFEIHSELCDKWVASKQSLVPVLGDITDTRRMGNTFNLHKPHVVFHCAAHKHVPMMEANPGEAIKNNILGTIVLADHADDHGVCKFVMCSTDKAVNPVCVMGMTKRIAELYLLALNQAKDVGTRYTSVRFGNVLGSNGSVVGIFKRQIAQGGPITVTHPEMTRYFMTIPEASQLLLQAASMGKGGDLFILDMGHPIKIVDLAREMIERSGLK